MSFCINCGHELVEGSKFCNNCGVTVNEFESKIQRKSTFDGEIHKCPNCGEILDSFVIECPSCKYELRSMRATSCVHELSQKLEDAKSIDDKKDLISNFYIPNTKEDIYEFFILAFSNISVGSDCEKAWSVKLEQAYLKAKLAFGQGDDFVYIQELYNKVKKVLSRNLILKSKDFKTVLFFLTGLVMILGGLIATYIDGTNNSLPFIILSAIGFIPFFIGIIMFVVSSIRSKRKK